MARASAPLLVVLVALAACGSRTELDPPGSRGAPVAVSPAAVPVSFSTGCSDGMRDWVLFDLTDDEEGEIGLYAMRADGSGGHAVTFPHAPAYYPSISPDGTKLLYATFGVDAGGSVDGGDDSALYMYDLTARTSTLVLLTYELSYAALSPDNQTIAYTTSYSLHAINADGTNDRALLDGPDDNGAGYGHPTFADDSTILYGGGGALGTIGADGTGNDVLLTEASSFEYPNGAFSPDHQRVVAGVDCGEPGPLTLSVFDYPAFSGGCAGGSVLTDVTFSSSANEANDPSWNPNGLIAYASSNDVFVIDAAGGTPKNLTSKLTGSTRGASDPIWVPACAVLQ